MKNFVFHFILLAAAIFFSKTSSGQNTFPSSGAAGIGTTVPDPSSLLDVSSTSKGILVPRMTKTQRDAIPAPSTGLLIYQTNNTPGFYYYSGTAWTAISSKGPNKNLSNLTAPTAVNVDLLPATTNTINLGSSTLQWKDLNLYNLKFSDGTTQSTAGANTALSNLSATAINQTLLPGTDNSQDLGSASFSWKDGYFDGSLYLGGSRFLAYQSGTGIENTAIGAVALNANTIGNGNTAAGFNALFSNTTGQDNTAIGDKALYSNVSGILNNAVGYHALYYNISGSHNIASGYQALYLNTTGYDNVAIGVDALYSNTTGYSNTAEGISTLVSNTTGIRNTANGYNALVSNTTGSYNVASGDQSLFNNTTASSSTAYGYKALYSNTTGSNNTANGTYALSNNTTGFENTALGRDAGSNVTTGSDNTFIGWGANCGSLGTLTNSTAIGNGSSVTTSNTFVFGNSSIVGWGFGVEAGSRAIKVGTSSSNGNGAYLTVGGTWTNTSSRDKKEDFQKQDRNAILEKINQLEVTKWKYKGTADEYHYGPMADDFHRLFNVADDSSISDMDKTGVLFLGVQALSAEDVRCKTEDVRQNEKLETLTTENEKLKMDLSRFFRENSELKTDLTRLNQVVGSQKSEIDQLKTRQATFEEQVNSQLMLSVVEARNSQLNDGAAKISFSNEEASPLLGQNLPNPFDNSTIIPFRIPRGCSSAAIVVTESTTGKLITAIPVTCDETHAVLDAGTLASGSYSYTLYVDGKVIDTKQMFLTK